MEGDLNRFFKEKPKKTNYRQIFRTNPISKTAIRATLQKYGWKIALAVLCTVVVWMILRWTFFHRMLAGELLLGSSVVWYFFQNRQHFFKYATQLLLLLILMLVIIYYKGQMR